MSETYLNEIIINKIPTSKFKLEIIDLNDRNLKKIKIPKKFKYMIDGKHDILLASRFSNSELIEKSFLNIEDWEIYNFCDFKIFPIDENLFYVTCKCFIKNNNIYTYNSNIIFKTTIILN